MNICRLLSHLRMEEHYGMVEKYPMHIKLKQFNWKISDYMICKYSFTLANDP